VLGGILTRDSPYNKNIQIQLRYFVDNPLKGSFDVLLFRLLTYV